MIEIETSLYALAEIRNRQIVLAKFNPTTENYYDDSYVYAIYHSVYPVYHEDIGPFNENEIQTQFPYFSTYRLPYQLVKEIAEFLDEKWRQKETITVYQLENMYGYRRQNNKWTSNQSVRVGLIHCLRYFYLLDWFDDDFWKKVMSECPSEAHGITRKFNRDEIQFFI